MRKTLLASVAAIVLVAAVPALADEPHHDQGKGQQGQSGGQGGGKGQGQGGGAGVHPDHGVGSGHTIGTQNSGTSGQSGGGMSGTTHHNHGNGGSGNAGSGSGGGSVGNNAMMGGSMSGTTHRDHGNGIINNTSVNANTNAMTGHGNRSHNNNTTIIFGTGGHGYKNKSDFGHASHNSAFNALRRAYHATHHYHAGSYHQPNGWYYRAWNYGDFLPALFFGQDYFISDYEDYDLPDPPDGAVWVRYGNDALMVDEDSGEIIQVIYGEFY